MGAFNHNSESEEEVEEVEVGEEEKKEVGEEEKKVEEKKVEEKKEDAPHFPALSAQDMAVFSASFSVMSRERRRFDVFAVLRIDSYPFSAFHVERQLLYAADAAQEQLGEADASCGGPAEVADSLQHEDDVCGAEGDGAEEG